MKVALLAVLIAAPLAHAEHCYLVESYGTERSFTEVDRADFDADAAAITTQTKGWRLKLELAKTNRVYFSFHVRRELYAKMREAYGKDLQSITKPVAGSVAKSKSLKDVDSLQVVLPVKADKDGKIEYTKAEINCAN